MQPKYQPSIPRERIVQFAMCYFGESRETATKRVRKTGWGYIVKNPVPNEYGLIPLGEGPVVVHGDTGTYIALSSSPGDMFGPHGLESLHSVDNLDAMIDSRGRVGFETIDTVTRDCSKSYEREGKPHVHE
jgi:hypothetical protein